MLVDYNSIPTTWDILSRDDSIIFVIPKNWNKDIDDVLNYWESNNPDIPLKFIETEDWGKEIRIIYHIEVDGWDIEIVE